jgi:hypothetical protein
VSKERTLKSHFLSLELLKIILVEVGEDKEMMVEDLEEEIEIEKDLETMTSKAQEMEVEVEEEIVQKVVSIVGRMVTFQENVLSVIESLFSQKGKKWWRI